jgi:Xaa-Pro dipeptidase
MHTEQRRQAHDLLASKGVPRALFANPDSIVWLTGFAASLQMGPDLFAGGPPLLWYEDGSFTLIVVDAYAESAIQFDEQPDCRVITYTGYTYEVPLSGADNLIAALRPLLAGLNQSRTVGIESRTVPHAISTVIQDNLSLQRALAPIDGWLEPLRMVKTRAELSKLRENFELADIGQAAARRAVEAGTREIDIWTAAHSAIEKFSGQRVALGNDCIVGTRRLNFTGWPLDYEIKQNDSVIVDLGTALNGYWSDGCATYFASEPTPDQRAIHQTVSEALDLGISMVRPGVKVRELDRQVRGLIVNAGYPDYPHHTGHGVGVSRHEAPRVVPYSDEVLEVGMVIMLEPGVYLPGITGVRLEDAVLVTADGAEVLTHHDKSLP